MVDGWTADVPSRRASHPGRPGSWWASCPDICLAVAQSTNGPLPSWHPSLLAGAGGGDAGSWKSSLFARVSGVDGVAHVVGRVVEGLGRASGGLGDGGSDEW